jgi:hypothetical protein
MQNHYNLLHREEEREMMPSLKVHPSILLFLVWIILPPSKSSTLALALSPGLPLHAVRSPVRRARQHSQRRRHYARKVTQSYPGYVPHPRCAFEMCRDVGAVVLREYLIVKQGLARVDRSMRTTRII